MVAGWPCMDWSAVVSGGGGCQRISCFTLRMGAGLLISLAELITLEDFNEEDD